MLTIKEVKPGVSGDQTEDEGQGGFNELVDLFLAAYSSRLMQYGSLLALALVPLLTPI